MRKLASIFFALVVGEAVAGGPVTFERLLKADAEPGNWLMYSADYTGRRFSKLDQIHAGNVSQLMPKWMLQMRTGHKVETTPLVVDGIMYLTQPPNNVWAVDAESGRRLWTYTHKAPEKVVVCCGQLNRGLAILGDRLFM